ncbi:hypothetical protein JCM8547_001945 [Rhodosporidiobolus lusitaniae]
MSDSLYDWSDEDERPHDSPATLPALRPLPPPHFPPATSAQTAPSPAASETSRVDEDEEQGLLELDSQAGSDADEEDERDEDEEDGDEAMEGDDSDQELLDLDVQDDDDLAELSFSSTPTASSPGQGPTTPRDDYFDEDDEQFSLALNASQLKSAHEYSSQDRSSPRPAAAPTPSPSRSFSPRAFSEDAAPPSTRATPNGSRSEAHQVVQSPRLDLAAAFEAPLRAKSPTQAEMDAFFGYVDPLAPPSLPSQAPTLLPQLAPPTPRLDQAVQNASQPVEDEKPEQFEKLETSKGRRGAPATREKRLKEKKAKPSEREYYQLQPIPTFSSATGEPLSTDDKRLAIISSLQRLALSVLQQISDNTVPSPPANSDLIKPARVQPIEVNLVRRSRNDGEEGVSPKQQSIRFPRKCGQGDELRLGGRELAYLLKVIELILEGLDKRVVSTKRDLYYRDVALFAKQATVDALVEDIAATLQIRRSDLNVVAAAKGLFAGSLKLFTTDGKELEGQSLGTLIPPGQAIERIETDEVEWVLVVEKEAVFQTLCIPELLHTFALGKGVLLTGKGYPDLATRELVKRLADELPSVPIFALVDSDPHGLEILSTYRFGSASLSFDSANLTVGERIEWLGVKGTEWDALGIDRDELLPLTKADRSKALAMLNREWLPEEWRRELEYMLHLGRKAEIQAISSTSSSQPSQPTGETDETSSSRLIGYVRGKIIEARSRMEEQNEALAP